MHKAQLNCFQNNPWQPRKTMRQDRLEELAAKIYTLKATRRETLGLLQMPAARLVDAENKPVPLVLVQHLIPVKGDLTKFLKEQQFHLQLAWGHRRRAAFKLLSEGLFIPPLEGDTSQVLVDRVVADADYQFFPFELVEFSDQEMFELAVTENGDRDDLTTIETAQAMVTYRDQFGKSSGEIGKLFGLSGSAVRNMIRLLELPPAIQGQVATGEISQGTARKLLTLQKLSPRTVENVAKNISTSGEITSDEVTRKIQEGLKKSKNAMLMWGKWRGKEAAPLGGSYLFDFDWRPNAKALPRNQFDKYLPQYKTEIYYDDITVYVLRDGLNVDGILEKLSWVPDLPAEFVTDVVQLTHPPACKGCTFYGIIEGDHYCGAKPCWEIKRDAWLQEQAEIISRETGIPIYDPKRDGQVYEKFDRFGRNAKQWSSWWQARAEHLRLRINYSEYNYDSDTKETTGHPHIQVISIRAEYAEEVKKEQQARDTQKRLEQERAANRELVDKRRALAQEFVKQVAGPIFAVAFRDLNVSILEAIARKFRGRQFDEDLPEDTKERHAFARRFVATLLLDGFFSWVSYADGTTKIAKHLQGVAKTWGVKLPDDWDEQILRFTLEGDQVAAPVSAETPTPQTSNRACQHDWLEDPYDGELLCTQCGARHQPNNDEVLAEANPDWMEV